jgi:hypothetical protein
MDLSKIRFDYERFQYLKTLVLPPGCTATMRWGTGLLVIECPSEGEVAHLFLEEMKNILPQLEGHCDYILVTAKDSQRKAEPIAINTLLKAWKNYS